MPPLFDLCQHPCYTVADIWFLSTHYPYRDEVDLGIKPSRQRYCHGYAGKVLDSAVMTTQAESTISYGLIDVIVLGR
jgi:hypothetical protein